MNIKRPFAPSPLNKLDDFLLLNKPSVWSARAHLVFYYSSIFIIALAIVYYAVPDDARSASTVVVWVGFVFIICIIALVTWLIYLLRFNVFKRFGIIKPVTTLVDFLLYFFAASVIVSFCFIPMMIETAKANQQYTSNELADDMNNINLSICRLEYDSLPKQWSSDTLEVHDTLPNVREQAQRNYDDEAVMVDTVYRPFKKHFRIIDTAALANIAKGADSLNRINDSTYISYSCPDYTFLHVFNVTSKATSRLLTSAQIFHTVIEHYEVPDKVKVKMQLKPLIDKYYYAGNERYDNEYDNAKPYPEKIRDFYKLRNAEESIENITERKYRWLNYGEGFCLFWFYCSFLITLLVFTFRHSTVRVFFLSLLSIVIIFILTMLLMAFVKSKGLGYYWCYIFYFILFIVISTTAFRDTKRKAAKGVAINLFVLMLPFIPLLITSMYYEWLKDKYSSVVFAHLSMNFEDESLHYFLVQIAGPVIFLVLLPLYVHQLYRQWYGLPEE